MANENSKAVSQAEQDDNSFLESLRTEFFDGAPGELDMWEENLLNFESSGEQSAINDLKRLVHSMKGSAQAIGLVEPGEFLHSLEAWLMDNMNVKTRTEIVSHCLFAVDRFRSYYAALIDGHDDEANVIAGELRKHLS
jgi:chemotaxis protein histidine kinase CheA